METIYTHTHPHYCLTHKKTTTSRFIRYRLQIHIRMCAVKGLCQSSGETWFKPKLTQDCWTGVRGPFTLMLHPHGCERERSLTKSHSEFSFPVGVCYIHLYLEKEYMPPPPPPSSDKPDQSLQQRVSGRHTRTAGAAVNTAKIKMPSARRRRLVNVTQMFVVSAPVSVHHEAEQTLLNVIQLICL